MSDLAVVVFALCGTSATSYCLWWLTWWFSELERERRHHANKLPGWLLLKGSR